MISNDTWKRWVKRFWWLRGVAAALALTTAIPAFVDMNRFEFLGAVYFIVLSWNQVATYIGALIGNIPWVPDFSADLVSTLVLFISVCVPFLYSFVRVVFMKHELRNIEDNVQYHDVLFSPIKMWEYARSHKGARLFVECLVAAFTTIILLVLFLFSFYVIVAWGIDNTERPSFFTVLFVVLTILTLGSSIAIIPLFGRGIFIVVTFIATLQVLYLIGTPELADAIISWVCELAEMEPSYCGQVESFKDGATVFASAGGAN